MGRRVQTRGGTTAEHSSFTGAVREITVDTEKNTVVVHDGETAGGVPLAKAIDVANEVTNRNNAIKVESDARVAAIETEKGRIDAMLDAVDADKDSFAEIVSLVNSVDVDNDDVMAGYVTSNNDRVAAIETSVSDEVTNRNAAIESAINNIDCGTIA